MFVFINKYNRVNSFSNLLIFFFYFHSLPTRQLQPPPTARGRRPRALLKTKGTVFPYTDRPRPVNNIFIYSNICEFTGQSLKVAGTRLSFIESAGARKLGSECNYKLLKLLSLSLIFSTKDYPIISEKVAF